MRNPHRHPFTPLHQNPMPQWFYQAPGVGGGGRQIQGKLKALTTATGGAYNGKKVGTIEVEVAGCSDTALIGKQLDVVDWSGCVFDLTFANLGDVWVWATEGIAVHQTTPSEFTPCHWTAVDRCCVAADRV